MVKNKKMETLNLFEALGITPIESKTKKKEVKSNIHSKKTSPLGKDIIKIPDEGITIVTGYYDNLILKQEDVSNNEIKLEDIMKIYHSKHPEYIPEHCKFIKLKSKDTYMISLNYSNLLSKTSQLKNPNNNYRFSLAGFETTINEEVITLEHVEKLWEKEFPDYGRCDFGYDEEHEIIVPLLKPQLEQEKIPLLPITISIFGGIPNIVENLKEEKELKEYINKNFPCLEDNFKINVKNKEDKSGSRIFIIPEIQSSASKSVPKKKLFPTKSTISLAFQRIEITPTMFGGKEKVEGTDILNFISKDYPEYSEERTQIEYDKKNNLIILILKSSRKGSPYANKDILAIAERKVKKDAFVYHYQDPENGEYRIEQNPIGFFLCSKENKKSGFNFYLPKIPSYIFEEVYYFFKMTDMLSPYHAEAACQLFYDVVKNEYFIFYPHQQVGPTSVRYERDGDLERAYILVMDIHSHNILRPYFSSIDDNDEKGTRLFCVFGHLTNPSCHFVLRAGTGGYFIDVNSEDIIDNFETNTIINDIEEQKKEEIFKEIKNKVIFN